MNKEKVYIAEMDAVLLLAIGVPLLGGTAEDAKGTVCGGFLDVDHGKSPPEIASYDAFYTSGTKIVLSS